MPQVKQKSKKGVLGPAEIRRNRGISLAQIADSTKISIRSLEAIEKGEFSKLPGGIYNTNYIRQYARAIDYDESILLAQYQRAMARSSETVDGKIAGSKASAGGLRIVSGLLGLSH